MDSRDTLTFGNSPVFVAFCPVCGLPLLPDGACKKYHKLTKKQAQKKYSGKSKSQNSFNDYQ
jgi:hypothetical protein